MFLLQHLCFNGFTWLKNINISNFQFYLHRPIKMIHCFHNKKLIKLIKGKLSQMTSYKCIVWQFRKTQSWVYSQWRVAAETNPSMKYVKQTPTLGKCDQCFIEVCTKTDDKIISMYVCMLTCFKNYDATALDDFDNFDVHITESIQFRNTKCRIFSDFSQIISLLWTNQAIFICQGVPSQILQKQSQENLQC